MQNLNEIAEQSSAWPLLCLDSGHLGEMWGCLYARRYIPTLFLHAYTPLGEPLRGTYCSTIWYSVGYSLLAEGESEGSGQKLPLFVLFPHRDRQQVPVLCYSPKSVHLISPALNSLMTVDIESLTLRLLVIYICSDDILSVNVTRSFIDKAISLYLCHLLRQPISCRSRQLHVPSS